MVDLQVFTGIGVAAIFLIVAAGLGVWLWFSRRREHKLVYEYEKLRFDLT
jgi:hypothetical protein